MGKKLDKDDPKFPNKRIEDSDTTYTKLYPQATGPLQPSKHWENGWWLSTEETSIVPDDGSRRIPDDSSIGSFSSPLFWCHK
jgi:hypothetical protein